MSNFISIDDDYIFVADIYKNFQIFKLKDKEEIMKEKLEDSNIITLKRRFQSKIDCNCIAVYPFSSMKNLPDLKQVSLFTAS